MSGEAVERFRTLLEIEDIPLSKVIESTNINRDRWKNVRDKKAKMTADEVQVLSEVFPKYAYWLATGKELPEAGQISPMTNKAQQSYKKAPKVG